MKHIIRTSDRKAYKECREAWNFGSKIRMDYEPLITDNNLWFGTAIHRGMETYYNPATWTADRDTIKALAIKDFLDEYKYQGDPDNFELQEQWQEYRELGKGMMQHYFEWCADKDNFTPLYTEIEFEVPVLDSTGNQMYCACHNWPVFYQGRIDMMIQDEFGNYWIVDFKTAARLDANPEFLMMDEQVGSYAWAIQQMLGIQITGVVYLQLLKTVPHEPKVLKNGTLSKDKQQNTTLKLYLDKLTQMGYTSDGYEDILDFFKAQPNKFFRRVQIHRSQAELRIIGERIALEAREMIDPVTSIYPNPSPFRCGRCAFKIPCLAKNDGSDFQWILEQNYKIRSAV